MRRSLTYRFSLIYRIALIAESLSTCFTSSPEVTLRRWAGVVIVVVSLSSMLDWSPLLGFSPKMAINIDHHHHPHHDHQKHQEDASKNTHLQQKQPDDVVNVNLLGEDGVLLANDGINDTLIAAAPIDPRQIVLPIAAAGDDVTLRLAHDFAGRRTTRVNVLDSLAVWTPELMHPKTKKDAVSMMDSVVFFGITDPFHLLFALPNEKEVQASLFSPLSAAAAAAAAASSSSSSSSSIFHRQGPIHGALFNIFEFILRNRCSDDQPGSIVIVDFGHLGQESVLAVRMGCQVILFDPTPRYQLMFWASMSVNRLPESSGKHGLLRWHLELPSARVEEAQRQSAAAFLAISHEMSHRNSSDREHREVKEQQNKQRGAELLLSEVSADLRRHEEGKPVNNDRSSPPSSSTVTVWVPNNHCTDCAVTLDSFLPGMPPKRDEGAGDNNSLVERALELSAERAPLLAQAGRFVHVPLIQSVNETELTTPSAYYYSFDSTTRGSKSLIPSSASSPSSSSPSTASAVLLLYISVGVFADHTAASFERLLRDQILNVIVYWPTEDAVEPSVDARQSRALVDGMLQLNFQGIIASAAHIHEHDSSASWTSFAELAQALQLNAPLRDTDSILAQMAKIRKYTRANDQERSIYLLFSRDPRIIRSSKK